MNTRGNQPSRTTVNRATIGQCRGCGQKWTLTHRQVCPALGKKCNHCGLLNHFAKVCPKNLKTTQNSCQDDRIKNVENSATAKQNTKTENQNVNYINYNEQFNSDYDSSDENYVAMVESLNTPTIALQNMTITIGITNCHLLLDSGSGCTIKNMSLAKETMFICMQAQW